MFLASKMFLWKDASAQNERDYVENCDAAAIELNSMTLYEVEAGKEVFKLL